MVEPQGSPHVPGLEGGRGCTLLQTGPGAPAAWLTWPRVCLLPAAFAPFFLLSFSGLPYEGQSLPGRGTLSLPVSSPRTPLRQGHFASLLCGPAGELHNQRPCRVKEPPSAHPGDRGRCGGGAVRLCQRSFILGPWPGSGPSTWQDLRKPVLVERVRLPGAPPERWLPFTSLSACPSPPSAWQRERLLRAERPGHRLPLLA